MAQKALIIEDDKVTLDLFAYQLSSEGFEVATAETGEQGLSLIETEDFDVILTDLKLPDLNGIELVRRSRKMRPQTEIIVVTGNDSAESAIEATRVGAFGYIVKPVDFGELMVDIRNAVERKRQTEENERQANEIKALRGRLSSPSSFAGIIGASKQMQRIYEIIENVAESDANVLILGESGTGKEVIANAIHYRSQRSDKVFVKVNCSALPKELIESQLFGHVKGAFTGANSDKTGFIGQANGGSLLLDEIAEMPVDLQPKLLRVLQEKAYQPVGSEKTKGADFRLISATNRDPFEAMADGSLREDLYYRINTIEIRIPPLRERMEDVPALAEHFLKVYSEKYDRPGMRFTQQCFDQMLRYQWRGNVRELQNAIERAVLLSKNGSIERLDTHSDEFSPEELERFSMRDASAGGAPSLASQMSDFDAEELIAHFGQLIVDRLPEAADAKQQQDVFELIERRVVEAALRRTNGNKQAAANLLGIYRPRLYGMIKRHSAAAAANG